MKFDLFLTLTCAMMMVFASAYTHTAYAQSIEDGLGGHWTFDEADTNADVAKDALGENDGEIKGAPKIVEGIVGGGAQFQRRRRLRRYGTRHYRTESYLRNVD